MSSLILVRHAQASFLEEDYDRLSAHGEEQARRLGEHWATVGPAIDEVIIGPRRRHRQTAEIVGQCIREAGRSWPDPMVREDWDEHQVDRLMLDHAPQFAARHPHLRQLIDAAHAEGTPPERARRFQQLFEAVATLWVADAVGHPNIETWDAFRRRIQRGLDEIVSRPGRGRRVAVFTSVGAVTVAMQRAMRCDDRTALATGWRVWNCSLTEFAFSGDRFTLDRFNSLPHLPDPRDWTYR